MTTPEILVTTNSDIMGCRRDAMEELGGCDLGNWDDVKGINGNVSGIASFPRQAFKASIKASI